jgi:hypothetical protein
VGQGILLIAGGILVALAGVGWGLDAWGMTTKFYGLTTRSWRKIPFLGAGWIRRTPYRVFRLQACIPWTAFGLLMIAIGIHLVAAGD